jgi:hypothetical protein
MLSFSILLATKLRIEVKKIIKSDLGVRFLFLKKRENASFSYRYAHMKSWH